MKSILILGAGRSSTALIDYILKEAQNSDWNLTVGDATLTTAQAVVKDHPRGKAITFNLQHEIGASIIKDYDLVISMLPSSLNPFVARKCLQLKKHLFTASYVSDEMNSFDDEAHNNGLLFLNECGLDPGLDHMSAMKMIDKIKSMDGQLYSFESFAGGLISPETAPDNPWRYKFTWNPINVVLAGFGTAKYLQNGKLKYIPYHQLFQRLTTVHVPNFVDFEGYVNRDSLKYKTIYRLHNIKTIIRGTLRQKGFCAAWNIFVQLGCTDNSFKMQNVASMTHSDFIASFLETHSGMSTENIMCNQFNLQPDGPELARLKWLGLFTDELVGLKEGTPAEILEHILKKRWTLSPEDNDLVVMWHRFKYLLNGQENQTELSLALLGTSSTNTAMAKLVGLPLAIATKLFLNNRIESRGVVIPTLPEFYTPILRELEELGIRLEETNHTP